MLEELLPPAFRDSAMMRFMFRRKWGSLVDDLEMFRRNISSLTAEEYDRIYARLPRIQDETDNSEECLRAILNHARGPRICDVGCGTGYLMNYLERSGRFPDCELTGVDFQVADSLAQGGGRIKYLQAWVEELPFPDSHFDTVICTHVLEHILDIRAAITELRRVCRQRLLIVVPLEREYRFTFNPHLHFFPYPHSFLRYIMPVPTTHEMQVIGRDLLYMEEKICRVGEGKGPGRSARSD